MYFLARSTNLVTVSPSNAGRFWFLFSTMGRSRYSASQNTGYNCFRVFGSLADATTILTTLMYSLVLLGPSSSLATILATSSLTGSLSTAHFEGGRSKWSTFTGLHVIQPPLRLFAEHRAEV